MNDFVRVCAVKLERDSKGMIVGESCLPRKKPCGDVLVPYCKFKMSNISLNNGVFIIKVDDRIRYVGGTENLDRYFYGGCSKTCDSGTSNVQGWPSECRLKKGVSAQVKTGELVEIWFLQIADEKQRRSVKLKLGKGRKLEWDRRW